MKRGPAFLFGAIVAFGLGPAVWIGGTFATAEADAVPSAEVPQPVPSVSVSTVYIAVQPSDTPDLADIADAWVPPAPATTSASPTPSTSPTPSPSPTTASPSPSRTEGSPTPPPSFTPPVERTPTPSGSPTPSADPSLAA